VLHILNVDVEGVIFLCVRRVSLIMFVLLILRITTVEDIDDQKEV